MRETLALYLHYLGLSVRSQMEYRGSFLMLTAGQFLTTGTEFAAVWVLFSRFGSLRGWSLPEVALLYGIVNTAFALAEGIGRGWDVFPALVRSGEFDRVLLRPRGTALQIAGQEVQLMRVGRLAQALVVLGWAVSALEIAWSPGRAALLAGAIAGCACLFYGLFILQATLAFWTVESLEMLNTVTYGGIETGQFPMTIYRPWFRRFFTLVVPLAWVTFYPAQTILGREDLPGLPGALRWTTPAAGLLFLLAALRFWRFGVRHYRSTGS